MVEPKLRPVVSGPVLSSQDAHMAANRSGDNGPSTTALSSFFSEMISSYWRDPSSLPDWLSALSDTLEAFHPSLCLLVDIGFFPFFYQILAPGLGPEICAAILALFDRVVTYSGPKLFVQDSPIFLLPTFFSAFFSEAIPIEWLRCCLLASRIVRECCCLSDDFVSASSESLFAPFGTSLGVLRSYGDGNHDAASCFCGIVSVSLWWYAAVPGFPAEVLNDWIVPAFEWDSEPVQRQLCDSCYYLVSKKPEFVGKVAVLSEFIW
jgi:hypothetical protein